MELKRFGETIVHVNLRSGTVETRPAPREWVDKYVGARGLGVRYVLEAGPGVDPLSPDNVLCFLNGPLSGSETSMSGRWACVTKSPLSGTVTDSHQGGWTAARLRWAGIDGLIFEDASDTPVYAYVEDGHVELRDASDVWGRDIHETVEILRDRHGGKDVSVNAIGHGGRESLSLLGLGERGRSRLRSRRHRGAVGGVKKLKAIVIKAPLQARARSSDADADKWKADPARTRPRHDPRRSQHHVARSKGGLSVYGTNVITNITNRIGALGTRNSQSTSFGDRAEAVSGETGGRHDPHRQPDLPRVPGGVQEGGRGAGVGSVEGPQDGERRVRARVVPGRELRQRRPGLAVAKLIDQCNDLGMDPIELGNALSMYMEACERGIVTDNTLAWGDAPGMVALTDDIAARRGAGDLLAEGPARAAEKLGHAELAMACKGQAIPAYDPRGMKGMGLGYATSNRGACHLRGYVAAAELGVVPIDADPLAWQGKGALMKTFQDLHAFSDSMDLCKFSAFAQDANHYAEQYAAALGVDATADDVMLAGERVYNLERYYNNLAGFGAGSDTLPRRFLEEPSDSGGSEGHVCELDQMLSEYYAERGWEDGVVPEAKLRQLQIP